MDSLNIVVSGNIISVIKWDIYNILLYHPSCCLDVEIKMYICSKGLKRNKRHLLLSHNSEFMVDMLSLCTFSDYVQGICQWSRLPPFECHTFTIGGIIHDFLLYLQPLFLYLAHQAVHAGNGKQPLEAPPEYVNRFPYIENMKRRTFAGKNLSFRKICDIKQNNKMSQDCFTEFTWRNFRLLQSCFPVDPLLSALPSVLV